MCQNRNHKTMESLEQSLERVNAWIGNCDQKAGFLLAIIGVLVAILFSSDFIQSIMDIIVNPYKDYIRNPENNEFKLIRFIYSIFIVVSMTASIVSIIFALLSLTAAIDIKKYKRDINNSELVDNSLIFFGSISGRKYNDFKKMADVNYEDDLKSQIFINSTICTRKFKRYNISLIAFIVMLGAFVASNIIRLFC